MAMLRDVVHEDKCKTIKFPLNEINVDHSLPTIARMPAALARARIATQAESGGLSSLPKRTACLQARQKGCAGFTAFVQAEFNEF